MYQLNFTIKEISFNQLKAESGLALTVFSSIDTFHLPTLYLSLCVSLFFIIFAFFLLLSFQIRDGSQENSLLQYGGEMILSLLGNAIIALLLHHR